MRGIRKRRALRGTAHVTFFALAAACSGDDGESPDASPAEDPDAAPEATTLIEHNAWEQIAESDDPLADHRPDDVECADRAVKVEPLGDELSYGVELENCNYLAASQPSLAEVPAGASVSARIWHFPLTEAAGEEGEAHVALLMDDEIVWEEYVSIPADGDLLTPQWEAESDYPEGTEIGYHVHNHGDNDWNFLELTVE